MPVTKYAEFSSDFHQGSPITWTVPGGTTSVEVVLVGAGGAGCGTPKGASSTGYNRGGGGGGAGAVLTGTLTVVAGEEYEFTLGTPASRHTNVYSSGWVDVQDGGNSLIKKNGNVIAEAGGGAHGGPVPNDSSYMVDRRHLGGAGGSGITVPGGWSSFTGGDGGVGGGENFGAHGTLTNTFTGDEATTGGNSSGNPTNKATPGAAGGRGVDDYGPDLSGNTYKTHGGGGGGACGGWPTWAKNLADFSTNAAGDGGTGGGAFGAGNRPEYDGNNNPIFKPYDGGGWSPSSGQFGCGGGGAGQQAADFDNDKESFGGMGTCGIGFLKYTYTDQPPVIVMFGSSPMSLELGDTFYDPGAQATDEDESAITVNASSNVNTAVIGQYSVTYSGTDSENQTTTVTRTVNVVADANPPVVTLVGDSHIYHTQGTVYSDPGSSANDAVDGVVSVNVTGTVNINVIGNYTLTYTATDSNNNSASKTRTVQVVAEGQNIANVESPPAGTPTSGEISVGDIQRATQIWKKVSGTGSGTERSNLGGDASLRNYNNLSLHSLRTWMGKHSFQGGTQAAVAGGDMNLYPSNPSNPGYHGDLASSGAVSLSHFYDYAPLVIRTKVRPETYDVYHSHANAKVAADAYGATGDKPYTMHLHVNSAWVSKNNIGYGAHAEWTGLGESGSKGAGTGSGSPAAYTDALWSGYFLMVSWTQPSGSEFAYNRPSVRIGQHTHPHVQDTSGSAYQNFAGGHSGGGGAANTHGYKWGGSNTPSASYSDIIVDEVTFGVERTSQ